MYDTQEDQSDAAPRKQKKRELKRQQIAQSALWALQDLGLANTTLRDVVAKSDLSLGMIHYYFEDRDALFSCSIPDDHIDPRRSALFMARSILNEVRDGRSAC